MGDERRAAVARAGQVDHVGVALVDQPVQVDVDQAQPGRRAPVAEQPRLDVLRPQRLAQQRIVQQVDLRDGQVVGGVPVALHALQRRCVERALDTCKLRVRPGLPIGCGNGAGYAGVEVKCRGHDVPP